MGQKTLHLPLASFSYFFFVQRILVQRHALSPVVTRAVAGLLIGDSIAQIAQFCKGLQWRCWSNTRKQRSCLG